MKRLLALVPGPPQRSQAGQEKREISRPTKRWYRTRTFTYGLCTCFILALEGPFAGAVGQTLPPRAAAALVLKQDGTYDLRGRVVRCQPGQKVGIWVESQSITVANALVEGCDFGIVVVANAPGGAGSTKERTAHVTRAEVHRTTVGMFLSGNGGTASSNIVGGAKYGIVVTGDDYTLIGNQSNDNFKDGFLVTGDRNLLEGNEARRNGRAGIRVARVVPMVGNHRFLSFIQDQGLGNVIRGNTALDNKIDLVEFADCGDPPFPPLGNEWADNIFSTRDPECIQ